MVMIMYGVIFQISRSEDTMTLQKVLYLDRFQLEESSKLHSMTQNDQVLLSYYWLDADVHYISSMIYGLHYLTWYIAAQLLFFSDLPREFN